MTSTEDVKEEGYQKAPCEAIREVCVLQYMMPTRYTVPGEMIDAKSLVTDNQMDNADQS